MTKSELTALVRASPITHQQGKNILLAIIAVADIKNGMWAILRVRFSQKDLGKLAGLTKPTAHRHILSLIRLKCISRRRWDGKTWLVVREREIWEMTKKARNKTTTPVS